MAKSNIRKENYTAIADFMLASFERDLQDFTNVFRTIDEDYLKRFKQANDKVKNAPSSLSIKQEQKAKTQELYKKADKFKEKLSLLKAYVERSGVQPLLLKETITALKNRNIERVVKNLREVYPFFKKNAEKIEDMPEGYLDDFPNIIEEFEKINTVQNTLISKGKQNTYEGKPLYDELYKFISEIAKIGKIIYKDSVKKDDYTVAKIIAKLDVAIFNQRP